MLTFPHRGLISRPIAALVPVTVFLAACLAGCGGGTPGTITTLHVWYSTDDPVERGWSQQLATRYEATHPHTRVTLTDYSFADLNTKLQLALAAGNPPDLAYVTPRGPGIPAYVGAHRLRDLSSAAASHVWARKLRQGLLAAYNRPFRYLGAKPRSVVAVPTSMAAVGVLYNRTLLERLHLAIPNSLASFEHALARASAAGYTPIGIGNADGWLGDDWYLTLVNALVPLSALEPEQRLDPRFSFNSPSYLQAGLILQHWAQRSYLTPNFGGLDAQEGVDLFFHGKTVFQLISSSENAQILRDQQSTHLAAGVFAFPSPTGLRVMPSSGYLGWVVPAKGKNPTVAISFIDSLLSPSTGAFYIRQGLLPATRDVQGAYAQVTTRLHQYARDRPSLAAPSWQQDYLHALDTSRPGIYLDAAPIANLNATMEANVQLLLQGYEPPQFLVTSLEKVYSSHGHGGSTARIDGEF